MFPSHEADSIEQRRRTVPHGEGQFRFPAPSLVRGGQQKAPGACWAEAAAPYLRQSDGDPERELRLHEWSSRMSAAAFETVGHFEVLLRNAIDRALSGHFAERCGWHMCRQGENSPAAELS